MRGRCKGISAGGAAFSALLSFLAVVGVSESTRTFGHDRQAQAPLLPVLPRPNDTPSEEAPVSRTTDHRFTLRHTFRQGLWEHPDLLRRLDVSPAQIRVATTREEQDDSEDGIGPLKAHSSAMTIQRLVNRKVPDVTAMVDAARYHGKAQVLPGSAWAMDEVAGPNVTDRETVLNLARMAANAYDENRDDPEWTDAKKPYNLSSSFGWKSDSLRGHVFADDANSTIVISIKGTSGAVFDGAGTTTNDKVNDNLFFSCCCGQGGHYLWLKVCNCMTSTYTCNENCIASALRDKSRYYHAAIELYGNITEMYPDANVWITGHSLGGAVSSMLGLTFGLPVVTFEAVPDALPVSRLGLPIPPGNDGVHQKRGHTGAYHFGHTADPVYMGTCNAVTSVCTLAFYAMESVCHTGHRCVYDTVGDLKWGMSITTHKIRYALPSVYEKYDHLPKCVPDTECRDCAAWKFFKGNGSEGTAPPTTSTESTTYTRTETCKDPGWWGCNDPTTTSSTSFSATSTSTTTFTTTTCSSYGWFGNCLDPITTTITSETTFPANGRYRGGLPTVSTALSTSTCQDPGVFYGCWDEPLPAHSATHPQPTTTLHSATSASCHQPGIFWGCWDETTTTTTPAPSSRPPQSEPTALGMSTTCATPGLFWGCYDTTKEVQAHAITAPPVI